ncbi:MAG: catalase [Sandaracinaceae bacterium]|nr:catalase [Sandaracinaceae bacterium]
MTASTEWTEKVRDDEEARFEALAEILRGLQRAKARNGKTNRALHAKSHGGLIGTFHVLPDLPAEAAQGLFATPAEYPLVVRFSNGSGGHAHDDVDDVRGIGIKVIGVEGDKAIAALNDTVTQDFLMIPSDNFVIPTPEQFVGVVRAVSGNKLLALPRLIGVLGTKLPSILSAMRAGMSTRVGSILDMRLHTGLPIRFGDYAAKLDLVPAHEPGTARVEGRDRFARELEARASAGDLRWTLRVQHFVDETQTPIEDPTKSWPESVSPFIPIARLEIPRQDPASDEGRALTARIDELAFDPWHALAVHRPLGAMMRARNAAYRVSTQERGAKPEPKTLSDVTG